MKIHYDHIPPIIIFSKREHKQPHQKNISLADNKLTKHENFNVKQDMRHVHLKIIQLKFTLF